MSLSMLFSEEAPRNLEQEQRETFRLYQLTDPWLSRELLKLCRQAQKTVPPRASSSLDYTSAFLYGIVPEIARRLSPVKLNQNEINWDLRGLSNYELRIRTGHCLQNIDESGLPGWVMLSRDVSNGNCVLFALDRLSPGDITDKNDPLIRRIKETSLLRGKSFDGVWSPRLCHY